jgi:hypothetical protein
VENGGKEDPKPGSTRNKRRKGIYEGAVLGNLRNSPREPPLSIFSQWGRIKSARPMIWRHESAVEGLLSLALSSLIIQPVEHKVK